MPTNETAQRVAANVRAEMARRAVTQTILAERLGKSQHFISRRLSGKVPFSVDELGDVAVALNVGLTNLMSEAVA
jgi:transcriptional regulator with XRE-family HTH domain